MFLVSQVVVKEEKRLGQGNKEVVNKNWKRQGKKRV